MPDHLKNKTIAALFWSFTERTGQQVIQFIVAIILARLLLPKDFGTVAILSVFIAVANALVHSGFGQALIQKQDADIVDISSVFYFNLLIATLLYGLLYLTAPFISEFYNMPILTTLTRVLSINIIIGSFAKVQITLMDKNLAFKKLMKVTLIATLISGTVGIIMAYSGFGVWSLVAYSIVNELISTIFYWIVFSWRPSLTFSISSLKSMFPFGSRMLLTSLLWVLTDNIYIIAIGKMFSASELGFYSRAKKFVQLSAGNLTYTTERVTYAVYSSIQNDKTRLSSGMRSALSSLSMVTFPLMIGMFIVAEPLVLVLLTDKWLPCVPFLQLLCIVGIFHPLRSVNLNLIKSVGRSDLFFKLNLMNSFMTIGLLFITYRWGIKAIICGQIGIAVVTYLVINYFIYKIINYSIYEQVKDVFPYLLISLIMGACAFASQFIEFTNAIYLLTFQVVISIILYISLNVIFKTKAFFEIYGILVRGVEKL